MPLMRRTRRDATLRAWFDALPAEVVDKRPMLALGRVGALMTTGQFAEVDQLLDRVMRTARIGEYAGTTQQF